MAKDSFILYTEINDVVKELDDEQKGILFQTILDYEITGEIPDDLDKMIRLVFLPIKRSLDRNNEKYEETAKKRSEAGKKGMASRYNKSNNVITNLTNDNNVSDAVTNLTDNVHEHEHDNDHDSESEIKENAPAPAEVKSFGRNKNIPLTAEEFAELEKEIGSAFYEVLDKLSDHMASSGKTYNSYPATIRKWYRQDAEKEKVRGKPSNRFNNFNQRGYSDADYLELERQSIRRRA